MLDHTAPEVRIRLELILMSDPHYPNHFCWLYFYEYRTESVNQKTIVRVHEFAIIISALVNPFPSSTKWSSKPHKGNDAPEPNPFFSHGGDAT
jgi:hypothetical protein